MRIGLYGGSFNPPHAGHRLVSLHGPEAARARPGLVDRHARQSAEGRRANSPPTGGASARMREQAERPSPHRRDRVRGRRSAPATPSTRWPSQAALSRVSHFVWIMGADNLASFHRWRGWRDIARMMPIAVIDRPGWTLKATRSPAAIGAGLRRGSTKRRRRALAACRRRPGSSCMDRAPTCPRPSCAAATNFCRQRRR